MSDTQAQFSVLRQTADPAVADAIAQLIEKGEDHDSTASTCWIFPRGPGSTKNG